MLALRFSRLQGCKNRDFYFVTKIDFKVFAKIIFEAKNQWFQYSFV